MFPQAIERVHFDRSTAFAIGRDESLLISALLPSRLLRGR